MPHNFEAAEILTTGWCPLNCKYCYIPKTDKMKDLHVSIIESITADDLVDRIRSIPGPKTVIGLWGTEPILTMLMIAKHLPRLKKEFPELKTIAFSTSLVLDPKVIADFAREADKYGVGLQIQISLDGPAFITDENRAPGVTEKVVNNAKRLVDLLNEHGVKSDTQVRWKATLTIENIRMMNENPERIHEYFHFFEELTNELRERNKLPNIRIENSSAPTLTVPGKYTSEDGKELAKFFEFLAEHNYPNTYVFRFLRLMNFYKELYKTRMFTCSGGDSNIGFDGRYMHICHRTFYLNRPEYVESIMGMPKYQNWDVSHLDRGNLKEIEQYYIVDPSDEFNLTRFQYVLRGYHDFIRMKLATTYVLVKELALAGQASEVYLYDDAMAELLSLFVNTALSCPMENLLNTGSLHIPPVSMVRIFANGAFEVVLREAVKYARV
ncbi:MAG: hypothetical protein PWP76_646 [Candidatus Diapherotrites archaeon]|nr:hypothetical protein [Candidatus Diapherotrites archaeon]